MNNPMLPTERGVLADQKNAGMIFSKRQESKQIHLFVVVRISTETELHLTRPMDR